MRMKGVDNPLITLHLSALDDELYPPTEDAEFCAALELARRKKIGPYFPQNPDEKAYRKALGMLARAGYSYDIAKKVMETQHEDI